MESRAATFVRVLWMAVVLAVAFTLPARADAPLAGALVRVQAWAMEVGWHEGRVVRAPNGCTMVELLTPDAEGHSSIELGAIDWLEVRREGSWSTVSVKRLLAREPAACRGGMTQTAQTTETSTTARMKRPVER
ncbi:MAG: hypothetical protein ACT4O5_13270 [Gammaproteobacteria bacterium]